MSPLVSDTSNCPDLADMRGSIQALGFGTDTATKQTSAINSVYLALASERRWSWLEDTLTDLVMEAGVQTQDAPAARAVDRLFVTSGTDRIPLDWKPQDELRRLQATDSATGLPEAWSLRGARLLLWPIPDLAYTYDADVVLDATPLVDDSDEPLVPCSFRDVLVMGGALLMGLRERDAEEAAGVANLYATRRHALAAHENIQQRGSREEVVQTGFFDDPVVS